MGILLPVFECTRTYLSCCYLGMKVWGHKVRIRATIVGDVKLSSRVVCVLLGSISQLCGQEDIFLYYLLEALLLSFCL